MHKSDQTKTRLHHLPAPFVIYRQVKMSQIVACPKCSTQMKLPSNFTGGQLACPKCGQLLAIRAPASRQTQAPVATPSPLPLATPAPLPLATPAPIPPASDSFGHLPSLPPAPQMPFPIGNRRVSGRHFWDVKKVQVVARAVGGLLAAGTLVATILSGYFLVDAVDQDAASKRFLISFLAFMLIGAPGLLLAVKGIPSSAESREARMRGLMLMLTGVLMVVIAIVSTSLSFALREFVGFFVVTFGLFCVGAGLVYAGLIMLVTGISADE